MKTYWKLRVGQSYRRDENVEWQLAKQLNYCRLQYIGQTKSGTVCLLHTDIRCGITIAQPYIIDLRIRINTDMYGMYNVSVYGLKVYTEFVPGLDRKSRRQRGRAG